jgi:P-type conjugative transfer protein TrbJ
MKKTFITIAAITLTTALPLTSPGTGIPVIDVSAIAQAIKQGLTQIQQYSQQVQQYQLQLQQYANQVKNTVAPVAQIYQSATGAINSVMGVARIFQSGNQLQSTLGQFQSVNYWLSASPSQYTYQTTGSANQKQANDAMVNGIVAQSAKIQQDAATLQSLQNQAQSADGQMKALSAANQLAALEQQQLLQIRALLVQEQGALVARNSTNANDEAMRQAATQQMYGTQLAPQPHTGFAP